MNLNRDPKHKLTIRIDESGVIEVSHRALHDPIFLTVGQLRELVMRAPEVCAEATAAFNRAIAEEAS
jgi:hypothetical protein